MGEVGKARSGVGFPDKEQGGSSGTPFFKVSDMNNASNENEMNVANNYVTDVQIASHRWSPIDELPAIFFAKVGAAVMLNRKRLCRVPFLLDNNTMSYSLGKNLWDADFAKALFETVDLTSLVQVGALPSYNARDVEAMEIMLPKIPEQKQIGQYFQHLDNLITLHQRKYDKLVNVKKAMLEKMFPKDGVDVPEIRFKGFTEAWEQRKLGSLAIFNPKAELPNVFEYVDLESVVGTEMLSHRTESKRTAPSRAQRLAQTGDLFYQTVRPYQKNNFLFEKSDKYYVFSTGYAQMRPVVDGLFLLCIVQSNGFMKVVLDNCTGTSYPAIKSNDLAEIEVYSPINPKEQEYIGKLFKGIDNLITLHQRKYDKLVNVKKAMLEKMFPKDGADVPTIRFKGFTEAWEQRKLGEVVDVCSGCDYKQLSAGNIPVYGTGGYMLSVNSALSYKNDAIGIGRKGTIDKPYILNAPFWTVDTLFYAIPRGNNDLDFIFDIFQNVDWRTKDESTGVPSLSKNAINNINILTPKYDEQRIVGSYFSKLDTLITLHQRKLEKLKNLKKACLEKMFV